MISTESVLSSYEARYSLALMPIATRLEIYINELLADHVDDRRRVDIVVARAKTPSSFLEKASKTEGGRPKYTDPLNQILDQVGARIVAFYLSDIDPLAHLIKENIPPIEEQDIIPDSPNEFGYEGKHFILFLPKDIVTPELPKTHCPTFFELQVKTLFQHAWAQADHDLAYKPSESLSLEHKRKVAFTAAQAWGADYLFNQLRSELAPPDAA